jgi:hypothetical protein
MRRICPVRLEAVQKGGTRLGRGAEALQINTGVLAGIAGGIAVIGSVGMVFMKLVSWRLKGRDNCKAV